MTETLDDHDALQRDESEFTGSPGPVEALFGQYSVLSPGVQIVLEGRPVSAPMAE